MNRPTLRRETEWRRRGHRRIAGIDEAGRGPLAGPVCVAAVVLPEDFRLPGLRDSKQVRPDERERLFAGLIATPGLAWTVVMVPAAEIDRVNILQATHAAMRRAVALLDPGPDCALIDGRPVPGFPVPCEAIVKGDCLSLSVAAASIIAKVSRDRFMIEAARTHPEYGFERHKGYGTREHLAALRRHGPCPLHRRTFAPVHQLAFAFEEA